MSTLTTLIDGLFDLEDGGFGLDFSNRNLRNADLADLLDQIPAHVKLQVRELYLGINRISNLNLISDMLNLEFLLLSNNRIFDLSGIEGFTKLVDLRLIGNLVSDLKPIEGLVGLKNLELFDNPIDDYSPLDNLPDCKVFKGRILTK